MKEIWPSFLGASFPKEKGGLSRPPFDLYSMLV
jgi:hypothetical protein